MRQGTTYAVIPALQPDARLVELVEGLLATRFRGVVVVDDGSGPEYGGIFSEAEGLGATVLRHAENLGKGRALKTAFNHILVDDPDAIGCVTADCDGQHAVRDVVTVREALRQSPESLVMGVRRFDGDDVPTKSKIGNAAARRAFALLGGVSVSDTQTGLRGVPASLMRECLSMPGERFELEMDMLASCRGRREVVEVPIATLYDSKEQHATHYRPVADSLLIARTIARVFVHYALSSIASSVLDLVLFALLSSALMGIPGIPWVVISTVVARCVSATFNFTLNWRKVFRTGTDVRVMAGRYAVLAITLMCVSALMSQIMIPLIPLPPVLTKACVDACLFAASYAVQGRLVFRDSRNDDTESGADATGDSPTHADAGEELGHAPEEPHAGRVVRRRRRRQAV